MGNSICSECIRDSHLKRFIKENGKVGICNKCCAEREHVMAIANREFKNRLKAAIRYNYSEMLYNTHWGGYNNWIYLFEEENRIFKTPLVEPDEGNEDDLYWELNEIEGHVRDYSTDVSLYYGGERLDAFFDPIMRDRWNWVSDLSRNIEYNNPDVIAKMICEKIKDIIKPLENEIENVDLYRARIGVKEILVYAELGEETEMVYIPYKKEEIGAPWPKIAGEGRFNRKGTAYLYLASDRETAINEIRPSIGHHVSIGQFRIEKKIKIVDFTNIDFYDYATSDDDIDKYVKLKNMEEILCIPNPDKEYRLTQGFSDAFIALGYDGIKFNSSVSTDTYNIVLFSRNSANYMEGTHEVLYIKGLKYDVKNENMDVNQDNLSEYVCVKNYGSEGGTILENFGMDINGRGVDTSIPDLSRLKSIPENMGIVCND